ncbi:MAG: Gfo/Idh/MocA family oxidoreductase [Rhodospirillales bacterium]|nr:MAG: Gfo/Idh/MocA family oxidoreductase [Rhodospirillales bacterium]
MASEPVKVGIVGLGRWAKVLTRATQKSERLEIVAGYSRSDEKRQSYHSEFGINVVADMATMLDDPDIKGVILTVPNEQHLPVAESVAKAGKHVYTEKPIANTLENGLRLAALAERYGVRVMVGHSARLLKGTRRMKQAIDTGEIGRLSFIEANFSNERALELTPDTWRWYRDKAPGGPLSQLAIHQFDALHYLGGEIAEVSSMASKLSPVGAEVDDQSMTLLRFADGAIGYVGSCWTSPGIYQIRVFGQKGLIHYELDFGTWDNPDDLHKTSLMYIQRGKDAYGQREVLDLDPGNMFVDELEIFAEACATGRLDELTAHDGVIALAVVNAALQSIERKGQAVELKEILDESRRRIAAEDQHAAE